MAALRLQQVQRFILVKTVFWDEGHFNYVIFIQLIIWKME